MVLLTGELVLVVEQLLDLSNVRALVLEELDESSLSELELSGWLDGRFLLLLGDGGLSAVRITVVLAVKRRGVPLRAVRYLGLAGCLPVGDLVRSISSTLALAGVVLLDARSLLRLGGVAFAKD